MKKKLGIFAVAVALLAATMFLVACGGSDVGGASESSANQNSGAQTSENLTVNDLDFTLKELDLAPRFAPSDMPEGNAAFLIMLDYSGNGDVKSALEILRKDAVLTVNGEQADIPSTAIKADENFVTLFSSTSDDLEASGLSIELSYDGKKLVIK